MRKHFAASLFLLVLCSGVFSSSIFTSKKESDFLEYAPVGMVAQAAGYTYDYADEPNYSTENTKTFQYLNLGKTLKRYRGEGVKVGIIDSGINYNHEDFKFQGSKRTQGESKCYSYQSGWQTYQADIDGYEYINDTLGHGTNVAATVAAAINGVGGLGLAPKVDLYVYKVTNSSNGYEFAAIQRALEDAITLGIDVIICHSKVMSMMSVWGRLVDVLLSFPHVY